MIRVPCRIVNQVTHSHFSAKKGCSFWIKKQPTIGHSYIRSYHENTAPNLPVPLSRSWIYGEGLGGYRRLLVPNLDSINGEKFIVKGKTIMVNLEKNALQWQREIAKMDSNKLYEILIVQGPEKAKQVIHIVGIWRERSFRIITIAYKTYVSGYVKVLEERSLVAMKDTASSAKKSIVILSETMQSYEKTFKEQLTKLSVASSQLLPRIQSNLETAKISATNLKNCYLVALPNKLVLVARDNQAAALMSSAIPIPIRNGWKSVKGQLPKLQNQIANLLQKLQDMINRKFNK